jgi:hypothetical protein
MTKNLAPVHPGEVLLKEYLRPLGLSQMRLALGIGVPPRRINEVVPVVRNPLRAGSHLPQPAGFNPRRRKSR